MNIAIIPARGGSKRVPRKNIKFFYGKPLIAYSIEAAKKSGCFDRIIVSTDDSEIAKTALEYGAEVPFIRPNNIADDYATTLDVINHAVKFCIEREMNIKYVCCIYATAPFLLPEDLIKGLTYLKNDESLNYAFSATNFSFPIQRAIKLANNKVEMFQPEHLNTRSQDLEEAYHDAGQFYWGKKDAFLDAKPFFDENSVIVKLPRDRVQEIDTPEDWDFAEKLFSVINK